MHFIQALSASLLLASAAIASPVSPHVLHEKRHESNNQEWRRVARLTPDLKIPLRFALTQSNMDKGHDWLMDVSDPSSKNYGKHWKVEQLIDAFKASDSTVNAVKEWLVNSGIAEHRIKLSQAKNWLHVDDATVEEAESLIQAEYHHFKHNTGADHVACDKYSIPAHLKQHIDFVTPTVHMDAKVDRKKTKKMTKEVADAIAKRQLGFEDASTLNIGLPGNNVAAPKVATGVAVPAASTGGNSFGNLLAACNQTITLPCLQALYGVNPNSASLVNKNNSYGIVE